MISRGVRSNSFLDSGGRQKTKRWAVGARKDRQWRLLHCRVVAGGPKVEGCQGRLWG